MIDRKRPIGLIAAALALVVMSASLGCKKKDSESADDANGAATQSAEPDAGDSEVEVPTQDEADAEAADLIDEENTDEAFEDLQNEVDAEEAEDEDGA